MRIVQENYEKGMVHGVEKFSQPSAVPRPFTRQCGVNALFRLWDATDNNPNNMQLHARAVCFVLFFLLLPRTRVESSLQTSVSHETSSTSHASSVQRMFCTTLPSRVTLQFSETSFSSEVSWGVFKTSVLCSWTWTVRLHRARNRCAFSPVSCG